ncbi:unnamed protein product [Auanema sp. JU1783]|nr:unnamed protein product [Auanema sp. JU1783]
MSNLAKASVPTLRVVTRNGSSHAGDSLAAFRAINRLASEGKWDSVNNMPKKFLFGAAKKEAYAAFGAINHKSDYFSQSPFGQYFKAVWRIALLLGIVKAGVVLYDTVIPEEKRLHYKYRKQHGHGHDHEHAHH